MQALRIVSSFDPAPSAHPVTDVSSDVSSSPDESGVRRLPVGLEGADLGEDLSEHLIELRTSVPPPVSVEATRASFVALRVSSIPAPRTSSSDAIDFAVVLRSCPPPPPRPYEPDDLEDRWSLRDRATLSMADPDFDRALWMHGIVLGLAAVLGALLALA